MSLPYGQSHSTGGTHLSNRQEAALRALIDAFLPPLPEPAKHHKKEAEIAEGFTLRSKKEAETHFWTHRLSSDPEFLAYVKSRLSRQQRRSLSLLSTVGGTVWATGRLDGFALAEWPVPRLAGLIQHAMKSHMAGADSRVRLWISWKRFLCGSAFMYVKERRRDSDPYENPYAWKAIDYPGPHILDRARDAQRITKGLEELNGLERNIEFLDSTIPDECDVVVVGSGAGGAMAARVLSEAGLDVVIIDQGSSPQTPDRLLEVDCSYALPTESNSNVLLWTGGSMPRAGGATRFGMGICQPLPYHIRIEWSKKLGLADFALESDSAFETSLRSVLTEMEEYSRVRDDPLLRSEKSSNALDSVIRNGCIELGYQWEGTKLCLKDSDVSGMATLGCRYFGSKRTSLHDVSITPNLRLVDSARVERINTTKESFSLVPKATSVEYRDFQTGEKRLLKARKCVVVAAGALETPCLLRRSGLRNRHIGQHLHLNPALPVFAFQAAGDSSLFEESSGSVFCSDLHHGGGSVLHTLTPHPGLMAMLIPWVGPYWFKEHMLHLNCLVPILCMQRDTSEGRVFEGRDGIPNVDYRLNKVDQSRLVRGMRAAILIAAAGGAKEIVTGNILDGGILVNHNNQTIHDYLASLGSCGIQEAQHSLISMHQMGTCRMGKNPNRGAVDPNGEAWECKGLFVLDSSICPSATGVHPMITVMAMARMLSLRLANELKSSELERNDPSPLARNNRRIQAQRWRHALNLQLQAVVDTIARILVTLFLLIPGLLFWWFDLGCLLA